MDQHDTDITIIILSGDRKNAQFLTEALRHSRLKIKSAKTAQNVAAVQKLYSKKLPSVVFFDAGEPGNLISFSELISLNRAIPVIVITNKKGSKSGYSFLENGATDFSFKTKKYDPLLLEKSVRFSIESKVTAESLRLSNERYELVSKATSDMVWDWDLMNNRVFRSADGWDKVFGKAENNESVYADSWWDRVHPDDKKKSNDILESVMRNKKIQHFEIECRMMRNDNTYATVVDRGYAIRNSAGEVVRLIGATQDITEKKVAEKKFAEERTERQNEITEAVIRAQEQEREDLGKELHDNINQILATTKLYIEYALTNDDMRTELLKNAKGLVESAVAEIRRLSKTLLPPSLGEVGLIMALNELTDSIAPVSEFTISKEWNDVTEESLSEGLKLTVFRIIQEQLTNIGKHAQAKKVWITLKNARGRFAVHIKDNGNGFDPKQKVHGVGLKNIFSRAQLYNGKVTIAAGKGKGCELSILFKL